MINYDSEHELSQKNFQRGGEIASTENVGLFRRSDGANVIFMFFMYSKARAKF